MSSLTVALGSGLALLCLGVDAACRSPHDGVLLIGVAFAVLTASTSVLLLDPPHGDDSEHLARVVDA